MVERDSEKSPLSWLIISRSCFDNLGRSPNDLPDAARGLVVVRVVDSSSIGRADLLIFAIGYESRSTHVARTLVGAYDRGIGVTFGVLEELSFQDNISWARAQPSVSLELCQSDIVLGRLLGELLRHEHVARILVDVSSFPRPYLATIVWTLQDFAASVGSLIDVVFVYSIPEFSPPPVDHGPVVSFGAVHPNFVGAPAGIRGLATLIGLGYEPELALSAQQVLDPAETWLAVPRSLDSDFDLDVAGANEVLLDVVQPENIWIYNVSSPFGMFVELEAIVAGLTRDYNVVLVPLGPKMFALACLLVALIHRSEVGVWRLSGGGLSVPKDQIAAGPIVHLGVQWGLV